MYDAPAFHHGPRPFTVDFFALSLSIPLAISILTLAFNALRMTVLQ